MAISLGKVFEPFVAQRPICVMARGVLENLFNAEKIDALFAHTAEVQYTRELLFSSVVDLMGQVVLGVQPSVHAAYQAQAAQLGISDQAIYDKLRQEALVQSDGNVFAFCNHHLCHLNLKNFPHRYPRFS